MERRHDVLARERPRPRRAPGRERLLDRTVLLRVLQVQTVERVVARRPDRGPRERAARALRELLDEWEVCGAVDDVVERVVRAHPLAHDRAPLVAGLAAAQLLRDGGEALLRVIELLQLLRRDLRRRDLRREALELGPHHERFVQLLTRDRPDAHAAIRDERDEPECSETAQRLADRRARDVELLRQLLLAEDGPRCELARDDGLLDDQRDVVGLGGVETHSRRVYAGSVRNSTSSGASASSSKSCFASSPASTSAISLRTRAASKRPARTHCHTCDREISAVATSSIRLSIAAAPMPCNHASRYRTPTDTFVRSPASVISPGVSGIERSAVASGTTSSRSRSSWFGRSKHASATDTRSGCATHVPSNP